MIRAPNVLVLDEPTNHLDLESIEALVDGLKHFAGTLVFVSHDRWFVGRLANRIVEITEDGMRDYRGTYEEYVHHCGDDHLDTDTVLEQARADARADEASRGTSHDTWGKNRRARARRDRRLRELEAAGAKLAEQVDAAEARVSEIDAVFASPTFYEQSAPEEVQTLQAERQELTGRIARLMREWEAVEAEVEAAG